MCGEAMNKKELFEREFKADMLSLVNDRVSNVRLQLAKVLRNHFLNEVNGQFVFDLEVNDAIRILKKDKSKDVVMLVEDLQTFPLNEERDVKVEEFLQRLNNLAIQQQKDESDSSSQDEQTKLESDIQLDSIIEESKVQRKTNTGTDRNTDSEDDIVNSVFGVKRMNSLENEEVGKNIGSDIEEEVKQSETEGELTGSNKEEIGVAVNGETELEESK